MAAELQAIKQKKWNDSLSKATANNERLATEKHPQEKQIASQPEPTHNTSQDSLLATHTHKVSGTILFDYHKFSLANKEQDQLKALVKKMKQTKGAILDIYGLASADETAADVLSLKRLNAVVNYLLRQGIQSDHIKMAHYGNSKSLNGCMNANCPEDLLRQNRCVVYSIR